MRRIKKSIMYCIILVMLTSVIVGCSGSLTTTSNGIVDDFLLLESMAEISAEDMHVTSETDILISENENISLSESVSEVDNSIEEMSEESEEGAGKVEETSEAVEKGDVVEKENTLPEYTVEPMDSTMFAQKAVNVRKGPSTEYEKTGVLSINQEVVVTGKASTGWYEIIYNDNVGYVSGGYLGNEKVIEQSEVVTDEMSMAQESTYDNEIVILEDVTSTDGTTLLEENVPAIENEQGDYDIIWFPIEPETSSIPEEVTYTVYLDQNALELVNNHRLTNGKDILVWNTQYEQLAMDRITKIAENGVLSHEGNPGSAEVLCMNYEWEGVDAEGFIKKYLNSPGHYEVLLYGNNRTMVAATCKVTGREYGDEYYNVIIIF